MTIEARILCIGCSADLGPPGPEARTLCDRCAFDALTVAKLARAWHRERTVRCRGEERTEILVADEDLLLLTGLETLDVIERCLGGPVDVRVSEPLAKFRASFRASGPHSRALADAVRAGALAVVNRLHGAGTQALKDRLARTEKALADAETRAAMSQRLCDERFQRLADEVRQPQPN